MTRRHRAVRRPSPPPTAQHENGHQSKAQATKQARPKAINFLLEPEDAEPAHSVDMAQLRDVDADEDSNGEEDIDAPRVAQWIDDEQLELQAQSSDDGSPSPGSEGHDDNDNEYDEDHSPTRSRAGPSRRLRSLEDNLSTLPLGTLRNAQRSLAQAQALGDTDSDSDKAQSQDDDDDDGDAFSRPAKGKDREESRQPSKSKNELAKRANKHAPMEVTSKRPVSRRRIVVDDRLPKPRDPRFMHSAGRYDASKFKQRYDFLSDLRKGELSTLRENVKRAHKLAPSSPSHLRAKREEEVKRLERAMKRAESAVNLDNRERVELEALQAAKQVEKGERKQGKAGWWMKQPEKRELLAKARLDAIAAVGGKQAVKKAVEKKQKKIGQKEKKMRPFPQGEPIELSDGKRRRPVGSVDSRGTKRRKIV